RRHADPKLTHTAGDLAVGIRAPVRRMHALNQPPQLHRERLALALDCHYSSPTSTPCLHGPARSSMRPEDTHTRRGYDTRWYDVSITAQSQLTANGCGRMRHAD